MRMIEKVFFFAVIRLLWYVRPKTSTRVAVWYFRKHGMRILGQPRYISAKAWFDSTDYSLIELHEGCTISSNIRLLTHDWSVDTVARGLGMVSSKAVGRVAGIKIGKATFVGTGSIVMPGASIGDFCIIGAGTVVRGEVSDYSVVIGNPCVRVSDSRQYIAKRFPGLLAIHADSM